MCEAHGIFGPGDHVAVLTDQPLPGLLDYQVGETAVELGALIEVPLGPRKVLGVVWGAGQMAPEAREKVKIRKISNALDLPPMRAEMRAFLSRLSAYTLAPLWAVFRLATRAPALQQGPAQRRVLQRNHEVAPARMTEARARVLALFEGRRDAVFGLSEAARLAKVSPSVVRQLVTQQALIEIEAPRDSPFPHLDPHRLGKALTAEQAAAAAALRSACAGHGYQPFLLKGVTGSGKTEVYLEAVAAALAHGRQALVMLPEIALTGAFIDRVEARFGARPAEWHSGLTQSERRRVWHMVASNQAQMVIGARSSLFLPFQDLGVIIVDEEHDSSYKQEDGVLYNARDMAVLRASLAQATVVLASATPSLETWANAQSGKYQRLSLKERFGQGGLPRMGVIDMRAEGLPAQRWISERLASEIAPRLEAGEQALLFLNRRGYAPLMLCRACGHQIGCDHCDARMVQHQRINQLMCHQCGATRPVPRCCPKCEAEDRITPIGPGVERLAEEAAERFPEARIALLSSDVAASARGIKAEIAAIEQGKSNLIIGTQLVAKGHNFPLLTCVGVIDADLGLQGGDLRAAERSFQLLRQVAGRAGRAALGGVAFLQSYQPDHPVIQAIISDDDEAFWEAEAAQRRFADVPPFGRFVGVILSGPDLTHLSEMGQRLARYAAPLQHIGARVYGPAPAPISRIKDRFRLRLLVQAPKAAPIQAALSHWTRDLPLTRHERLTLDIDPQSFF